MKKCQDREDTSFSSCLVSKMNGKVERWKININFLGLIYKKRANKNYQIIIYINLLLFFSYKEEVFSIIFYSTYFYYNNMNNEIEYWINKCFNKHVFFFFLLVNIVQWNIFVYLFL